MHDDRQSARGLANRDGARLVAARGPGPYASLEDAWRRAGVPVAALRRLAAADAFALGLGLSRREALWAMRGLRDTALPLFAAADAREGATRPEFLEKAVALRPMTAGREVAEDYRATSLSLRAHPLAFLRAGLAAEHYVPCATLARARDGGRVAVAGLVLIRRKPGSAKGVMFITLEDEGGIANLIVWPSLFERQRALVLRAGLLGCRWRVQRQGGVTHVIADDLVDLTAWLRRVGEDAGFAPTTGLARPRDILVPDLHLDGLRAGEAAPPIRVRARNFH